MKQVRGLATLALAGALITFCALRLEFSTDITNFMPGGADGGLVQVSRELADSELTRTLVICVGAPELEQAVRAASELAAALRGHPEVAWLRSGLDPLDLRGVYELYFPRRHYYLSDQPERELPARLEPEALLEHARAMREQLAGPASLLLERVIPADPLGAFPGVLERMAAERPPLSLEDGIFVARESGFAVLLLATHSSAFASGPQGRLQRDILDHFAAINARNGGVLELEQGGVARFAVHAEQSLRGDLYLIAACSFLGVAALFWLFFRSLAGFGLAILPALLGILVATSAGLVVFGQIDGLTLAFSASLLGVAIDYSIHLLNHHSLAGPGIDAYATARRLRPPLVLGAVTTMASFAGLGLTSFSGFQEIAFVTVTAVGVALLATLFLLPDLLPRPRVVPALSVRVAERLADAVLAASRHPRLLAIAPIAVLALAAATLPRLVWVDDLSRLGQPDPALLAEDQRVRERVSSFDSGRVVIALADDPDELLRLNDRAHARLQQLVADGELEGVRSLHAFLWSKELAHRNLAQLAALPDLYERVARAYERAGFRPGAVAPFRDALSLEPPPPLTLDDLQSSSLAELVRSLVIPLGERTAALTYLRGVRSPEALHEALADLPDVLLFDQARFVNEIYGEFRETTLRQIGVGTLLVLLVLALRYRSWRPALGAFLPSVLAVALLLSGFALAGIETHLLHVVSLIMVMGMGVDYGIFVVDSVGERRGFGATLLSLVIACGTTVFVFGTLALSSHPALRAMGLTTGVGILLSLLLAPVALLTLRLPESD